jgi:hypothetical protein
MRRWHLRTLGVAATALVLSVVLVGCGKDNKKQGQVDDEEYTPVKKGKGGSSSSSGGNVQFVDAKGTTTIKGKVKVKGGNPSGTLDTLTTELHKQIDAKPDDKAVCLAGSPEETTQQTYRIGANNQVGNVFVWIEPVSKDQAFKVDEKLVKEAKGNPVVIDQPHCAFSPHVALLFAKYPDPSKPSKEVPTGQILEIKNSAKITHNTKYGGGVKNQGGNPLIQPGSTIKVDDLVPDPKKPVVLKCNIHPWMDGYVWVLNHPFATISKSDTAPKGLNVKKDDPTFGTFEVKNAPAGVKVRLFVWHEKDGFLTPAEGEEIETKDGETPVHDFELEVK